MPCPTISYIAFCTGELRAGRVSIKLLPQYTFLENILVEGKARNKHCQVNERKSSYNNVGPKRITFEMSYRSLLLGPVVQSIISLTSSLRGQLNKCFTTS